MKLTQGQHNNISGIKVRVMCYSLRYSEGGWIICHNAPVYVSVIHWEVGRRG
jgi:hypothetical protein